MFKTFPGKDTVSSQVEGKLEKYSAVLLLKSELASSWPAIYSPFATYLVQDHKKGNLDAGQR